MLIAQITDTHIRPPGKLAYSRVDTNQMLANSVAAVGNLKTRPDVVLLTGDLTDCGLIEEYENLKNIISSLKMPVYLIPGNHDRRDNLRQIFKDHTYLPGHLDEDMSYVIDDHPVSLIGLDSVVSGQAYGQINSARLAWLKEVLNKNKDKPAILFLHHPPFPTGIVHMDKINCRGGEEMAELVSQYPNIERVLAGHHHRSIHISWAGTIGSIAPSVAHQVLLDIEGTEYSDAMIKMEPPSFDLHMWSASTGVITHQAYVDEFPGPFEFKLDPDYPAYNASPVSA